MKTRLGRTRGGRLTLPGESCKVSEDSALNNGERCAQDME
jgi:hypothetical protein